jgi:hypothetical protein
VFTQPLTEMSIRSRKILYLRSRPWLVCKSDNLIAICELLFLRVHFMRDAAENLSLSVQRKSMLLRRCFLPQVPCDVLSGGQDFLTCSIYLVAFYREYSVDSVGVGPCWNAWMRPFLLLLRSLFEFLCCCVKYSLLTDVCNRCQPLRIFVFVDLLFN